MALHDVASNICQALGRGVTRSKRRAIHWIRKAAEMGHTRSCLQLAIDMYGDLPYAREVGHMGRLPGWPRPLGSWRHTTFPQMS